MELKQLVHKVPERKLELNTLKFKVSGPNPMKHNRFWELNLTGHRLMEINTMEGKLLR